MYAAAGIVPEGLSNAVENVERTGSPMGVTVKALLALAAHSDLVLFDLKEIDSDRHARFTGQPNERILANLRALAEQMRSGPLPAELWIRTPLIPGATASEANIRGIGAFIARELAGVVARWELCAFNNLAADKYRRLQVRTNADTVVVVCDWMGRSIGKEV